MLRLVASIFLFVLSYNFHVFPVTDLWGHKYPFTAIISLSWVGRKPVFAYANKRGVDQLFLHAG